MAKAKHKCPMCGKEFTPKHPGQIFDHSTCKRKLHNKMKNPEIYTVITKKSKV